MIEEVNIGEKVSVKYPNRLQELREGMGLTPGEVSQEYGCTEQYYIEMEQGLAPLSATAQSKLSEIFGVPAEELRNAEEIEIAGATFNLGDLQADGSKTIRLYDDGQGGLAIGSGSWLVAEIELPARKYETVEMVDPESGEPVLGDDGSPRLMEKRVPIDAGAVNIRLWAVK